VNISGRSLADGDFLGYIRTQLSRSGVDPSQLVFEITETAAITNVDDACRFPTSLSQLGCGIALDDFGTGFGSLHYLKKLPVDFLKIDGQFIQNLTTNPGRSRRRRIARADVRGGCACRSPRSASRMPRRCSCS